MLEKAIPPKRIRKIAMGVDTEKFKPVTKEKSAELKAKYGVSPEKKVVLHVGHLNEGRNVAQLMKLDEKYQVILVTSTLTKDEQDKELKNRLLSCRRLFLQELTFPPHFRQEGHESFPLRMLRLLCIVQS